jgi:hypothetical protein
VWLTSQRYQPGGLEQALYERARPGKESFVGYRARQRLIALVSSPPRRESLSEGIVRDNGPEFRGRALTAWENGVCRWGSFSRASRFRMPAWKASTAGCPMNVERPLVHESQLNLIGNSHSDWSVNQGTSNWRGPFIAERATLALVASEEW